MRAGRATSAAPRTSIKLRLPPNLWENEIAPPCAPRFPKRAAESRRQRRTLSTNGPDRGERARIARQEEAQFERDTQHIAARELRGELGEPGVRRFQTFVGHFRKRAPLRLREKAARSS
jgi:hypothetical protein